MENRPLEYDYTVAKMFMWTTIITGIFGMSVGVLIAFELAYPGVNTIFGHTIAQYTAFGRLRPVHTNAVIYGFTVSGVFATWYYVGQRVLKVSMAESKFLMFIGKLQFWLYLVVVVFGISSLIMGWTTSREYAEMQWPIVLGVTVVWVLWGISIFGLIGIRRERSLYISVWYYIATFLGIAMLYLFNNAEIPTILATDPAGQSMIGSWMQSISMYSGTNSAMVYLTGYRQWDRYFQLY